MLQIRLLGQFDVVLEGKRIVIPSRSGQSLLAYLALSAGASHRREKLAGLFWSDTSEEIARRNLRQQLWLIRKALAPAPAGADYFYVDEISVGLNSQADFWLDAAQLERPIGDATLDDLSQRAALYRGELLPGFYDDWVLLAREHIEAVFYSLMQMLVARLIQTERWNGVLEWSEKWLSFGSAPEPAFRGLMLAHAAHADMAKVQSVYQRCVTALHEELGIEPSVETRALYEGLVKGAQIPARAAPTPPSATVTFLFTDIQGSTRLHERLREQYATVLHDHRQILRAAVKKWDGREMDTQGDAFFVTFGRASDAVACAVEAQRALHTHPWAEGEQVRVRMGLHTGEPLLATTGYIGMEIHRAARIGDAAYGGQVLLSQTTRNSVIHDLPNGVTLRDLGEHRLKDLKYPGEMYQLVIEGLENDFPPLRTPFTATEPPTPGDPPFKGLQYFDVQDADLFFGREALTAKLLERISHGKNRSGIIAADGSSHNLLVVVGASGSGKSSLVRAGLIPAVKKELRDWRLEIVTPTEHPLQALATALTRDSESVTAAATLMDDLAQDPRALQLFLGRMTDDLRRSLASTHLPSAAIGALSPHTLLVVDQFEELFTLCRDEFERQTFIDNLLYAVASGSPAMLTIILTLRADFYAHLAQYPELRDAVARQQEYIGPMASEELRRAMQEPARQGHWEFEAGLVDLILRDVGDEPGALPLLSHALLETWKRRAGHTLTLKGYHEAGGVQGAIAHTADSTYQQLSPAEQEIARNIFVRLTELGEGTEDTRRRATIQELIPRPAEEEQVRAVLNRLAAARLITLGQDIAEVAHEALIREWGSLREWLNQGREGLRLHRHLMDSAQEWALLERDTGELYRGARLAQAHEWAALNDNTLNPQERAFLRASKEQAEQEERDKEEQRGRELQTARQLAETESRRAQEERRGARRVRWFAAGLGLLLIIALAAAWFAFNQSNVAQNNFVTAERIRLASQAQIALDNGEGGDVPALLALHSLRNGYSPEADAALLNALKRGFTRQIYAGHTDVIWSTDFSPDGRKMATASSDGTARVWDIETGQELARFAPSVRLLDTVSFAPDGRNLLVGGPGAVSWLWDSVTGQTVRQFVGNTSGVYGGDISPDGKYAVTADDKVARLWDIQSGKEVREFTGHTGLISPVIFSNDGRRIATAGDDGTARVYDVATGQEIGQFKSETQVANATFSPDGNSLLSVSGNIAQLWDIESAREIRRFAGHTDFVISAYFSPDARYVLTGSQDKTARLWDAATGQELRQFIGHTGGVLWAVFSPDGRYVLTSSTDRTARLWNLSPETEPLRHTTLSGSAGAMFIASAVSLSPDGQFLLNYAADAQQGKSFNVWNTQTGERHYLTPVLDRSLQSIPAYAFSPDNRVLAGGADDGLLQLWDAATGKLLDQLSGHTAPVRSVIFSPDGKFLLTGSDDKSARLWDAQTGKNPQVFLGHTDTVRAVAFSSDGKFVLTGSDDKTARLWDAQTGKELRRFIGHTAPLHTVAFSPDGKSIVTGSDDQVAGLWDSQTGKQVHRLIGHTAQISQATFSPDGQYVLTGSADQTARLWSVQTGQLVRNFVGHLSPVLYSGFADNGRTVITGDSQAVYRWRAALEDVIAFTCSQLTRDLTTDERTLYRITDTNATCAN